MGSQDELLFVVKAALASLPQGSSHQLAEALAFLAGMAPFMNKETVLKLKCRSCDYYSPSFFPIEEDLGVVDSHEFCHLKQLALHHLSLFSAAKCLAYTQEVQQELHLLAETIVNEDLRPEMAGKRFYDRSSFATFDPDYQVCLDGQRIYIELGHKKADHFQPGGVRLYLLQRLDPGFGTSSKDIARAIKRGRVMAVEAPGAMKFSLDLHAILEQVGRKRRMDIVYL
jgi:hypothetical protein